MVGFIALDEILRLFFRCVVYVAFEPHVRNNPLQNYAADAACFRVPLHVVTAFERLSHPTGSNSERELSIVQDCSRNEPGQGALPPTIQPTKGDVLYEVTFRRPR